MNGVRRTAPPGLRRYLYTHHRRMVVEIDPRVLVQIAASIGDSKSEAMMELANQFWNKVPARLLPFAMAMISG